MCDAEKQRGTLMLEGVGVEHHRKGIRFITLSQIAVLELLLKVTNAMGLVSQKYATECGHLFFF